MAEPQIEKKEVKINKDKKQTKVAIPAEFVTELDINPKSDTILWVIVKDENGTSLTGNLKRK